MIQFVALLALVAAASAGVVAPLGYAAPAVATYAHAPAYSAYAAPIAKVAAPLAYAAPAYAQAHYAAPAYAAHAAPLAYAAPVAKLAVPTLAKAIVPAEFDAHPQYR